MKIPYDDICRNLKRYSFEEKMRMCTIFSKKVMGVGGYASSEQLLESVVRPWELETFLLMSVKATPEYAAGNFKGNNINKFYAMVNGIRDFTHPQMNVEGEFQAADYVFPMLGLTQFDIQEVLYYKLFRYCYIFNFQNKEIDMKDRFESFFGTTYEEFMMVGMFLSVLSGIETKAKKIKNPNHPLFVKAYEADVKVENRILEYMARQMYPKAFKELYISVEDYKVMLDSVTMHEEDYATCLRPSYKYPFVQQGKYIYLPLPHLLGRAVTSSLLYRMTEFDAELRSKIGKEVIEKYVYMLLDETHIYDELYPEQLFKTGKGDFRTADVLAREGEDFLFVECKMSVPNIGLRVFDEMKFHQEAEVLVGHIVQMYKQLRVFYPKYEKKYNVFKNHPIIEPDRLWGVIVLLEDSFMNRNTLYNIAASKLGLEINSAEYMWMIEHVMMTSLYEIERLSLTGRSVIGSAKTRKFEGQYANFPIHDSEVVSNYDNAQFEQFKDYITKKLLDITEQLVLAEILPINS